MGVNGLGKWLSSLTLIEGVVFTRAPNWLVIVSNSPVDLPEGEPGVKKRTRALKATWLIPPGAEGLDKTPNSSEHRFPSLQKRARNIRLENTEQQ